MRKPFSFLFTEEEGGVLRIVRRCSVNGVVLEPGLIIKPEYLFGGVRLLDWKDCDLSLLVVGDFYKIEGFYKRKPLE